MDVASVKALLDSSTSRFNTSVLEERDAITAVSRAPSDPRSPMSGAIAANPPLPDSFSNTNIKPSHVLTSRASCNSFWLMPIAFATCPVLETRVVITLFMAVADTSTFCPN